MKKSSTQSKDMDETEVSLRKKSTLRKKSMLSKNQFMDAVSMSHQLSSSSAIDEEDEESKDTSVTNSAINGNK